MCPQGLNKKKREKKRKGKKDRAFNVACQSGTVAICLSSLPVNVLGHQG